MREADLFPPIKQWFKERGFTVHAEVKNCDVTAHDGERLIIVEMKLTLNLDLILQAVSRQSADADVYIAVPAKRMPSGRRRALTSLLKRLDIGLFVVWMRETPPVAELKFPPGGGAVRRVGKATTASILKEIGGRSLESKSGGTGGKPVMTAYRESALTVAVGLSRLGLGSASELRKLGTGLKTAAILRDDHYGWFECVESGRGGRYRLTKEGWGALEEYWELVEVLSSRLK